MLTWDYYKILAYITSFSVVIPLLLISKIRRESKTLWFLFIYLGISLFTEFILLLIASTGQSNLIFLEFYKITELILILYIYKTTGLFEKIYDRLISIISITAIIMLSIGLYIQWTGLFDGFAHTCIVTLSVFAFYKMFFANEGKETEANIHPFFWFNLAFFSYFSASFLLFLFGNLIRNYNESAKMLWTIHLFVNMFLYLIFTIGIWKHRAT